MDANLHSIIEGLKEALIGMLGSGEVSMDPLRESLAAFRGRIDAVMRSGPLAPRKASELYRELVDAVLELGLRAPELISCSSACRIPNSGS